MEERCRFGTATELQKNHLFVAVTKSALFFRNLVLFWA